MRVLFIFLTNNTPGYWLLVYLLMYVFYGNLIGKNVSRVLKVQCGQFFCIVLFFFIYFPIKFFVLYIRLLMLGIFNSQGHTKKYINCVSL